MQACSVKQHTLVTAWFQKVLHDSRKNKNPSIPYWIWCFSDTGFQLAKHHFPWSVFTAHFKQSQ